MVVFVAFLSKPIFDAIQFKFYQPSVLERIDNRLKAIYGRFDEYSNSTMDVLSLFCKNSAVKSCVNIDQNSEEILERQRQIVALQNKIDGFLGVRVVGMDGKRIHFSSFFSDIIRSDNEAVAFSHYDSIVNLPYASVESPHGSSPRIIFDTVHDRFIFSFPFEDNYSIYHGTTLFYISAADFGKTLALAGYSGISDFVRLISYTDAVGGTPIQGLVFNVNEVGSAKTVNAVTDLWRRGTVPMGGISDGFGGERLLFSYFQNNRYVGILYDSSVFEIDSPTRIALVLSIYICVYLLIFLILNFQRNPLVKLKSEILDLQTEIIREFFNNINNINWEILAKEIRYRKFDVSKHVKRNLTKKQLDRYGDELNEFIDASWETLSDLLENSAPKPTGNVKKLHAIEEIEDIDLSQVPGSDLFNKTQFNLKKLLADTPDQFDDLEDLDEVEAVAEVEAVDDEPEEISVEDTAETVEEPPKPADPVIVFDTGYKGLDDEIRLPKKLQEVCAPTEQDPFSEGMGINLENLNREKFSQFAEFFAELDEANVVHNPFLVDDIVPSIIGSLLVNSDQSSDDETEVAGDETEVAGDETEVAGDEAEAAGDEPEVTGDEAEVAGDESFPDEENNFNFDVSMETGL
ncbi:MAG: hypothetical protein IIW10_01525 [Spirochaetaceae bacterium]|nr:hypothetical protein [Spirochaetaceae bacterium]